MLFVSDPWSQLIESAASAWPPARWRDVGVVAGCSGGADSVALLAALRRLSDGSAPARAPQGFLIAAHFNHRLRGEESDRDEAFVAELADELGVRFQRGHAETPAADEASMRTARENFLRRVAEASGARYIAVAHSADDNVETMLHHLMRGTGPAGLAGIAPHRSAGADVVLVRPLLNVRRTLIRDALQSIGQRWREDSSNLDPSYRRNWIRRELIPLIEAEYPLAVDAMTRTVESQRSWRAVIERLAHQWLETHASATNGGVCLVREDPPEPALLVAALQAVWRQQGWPRRDMSGRHWQRLSRTMHSHCDQRYTLPGAVDVIARGAAVTVRRPSS